MAVTWAKIEIFKIQDNGGGHLENRFFGHQPIVRFQQNLVWKAERYVDKIYMIKTANF